RGRHVTITTTRPATQPTTQTAVTTSGGTGPNGRPATRATVASAKTKPTTKPSSDLDVMSNRAIESLTLSGSAQSTSTLSDTEGKLLRLAHVDSEVIQFFQPAPRARHLVIPGPGRMLSLDNRPPATQPSAQEAAKDPMGMRGQTAIQWKQHLDYDETKEKLVM